MTTIGLIGSGNIGSAIARLAVKAGHDVVLSNRRGPDSLADLVAELGDHARAATPQEAAEAGDVVVVTIPLAAYESVPVEPLRGKTVIDTNNYYPQRDGQIAELDSGEATSAELLQRHLPDSHVVKAFNNIAFAHIPELARPSGDAERSALAIAGDDERAKGEVVQLLDELGFDALDAGPLAEGWRYEPNTPAYGVPYFADPSTVQPGGTAPAKPVSADELSEALQQATR